MTREEAIELYDSKFREGMDYRQRATFQLFEDRLCMPFTVFHEAIEKTLNRPVYTHEFGLNREGLQAELCGKSTPPTIQEIMDLIPLDKRIIIVTNGIEKGE